MSSSSYNELTPNEILEAAIKTMGGIDLDPCAESPLVQRLGPDKEVAGKFNVPAATHFTEQEDGLKQQWHGRVFMNPPYGRQIRKWIDKLLEEVEAGRVTQAVVLLPSRTDTKWMHRLAPYMRCYIQGRLKFKGHRAGAPFPSVVIYVSDTGWKSFASAFEGMGDFYWLVQEIE